MSDLIGLQIVGFSHVQALKIQKVSLELFLASLSKVPHFTDTFSQVITTKHKMDNLVNNTYEPVCEKTNNLGSDQV